MHAKLRTRCQICSFGGPRRDPGLLITNEGVSVESRSTFLYMQPKAVGFSVGGSTLRRLVEDAESYARQAGRRCVYIYSAPGCQIIPDEEDGTSVLSAFWKDQQVCQNQFVWYASPREEAKEKPFGHVWAPLSVSIYDCLSFTMQKKRPGLIRRCDERLGETFIWTPTINVFPAELGDRVDGNTPDRPSAYEDAMHLHRKATVELWAARWEWIEDDLAARGWDRTHVPIDFFEYNSAQKQLMQAEIFEQQADMMANLVGWSGAEPGREELRLRFNSKHTFRLPGADYFKVNRTKGKPTSLDF
jgi:hypothetical protein